MKRFQILVGKFDKQGNGDAFLVNECENKEIALREYYDRVSYERCSLKDWCLGLKYHVEVMLFDRILDDYIIINTIE